MPAEPKRRLGTARRAVEGIEDAILVILLAALAGFAIAQIFLRNFFQSGVVWADPLLRILVLWVGLVGAMVATRLDKQIAIHVLTRYLSERGERWARAATSAFAAFVTGVIAYHAARFVAAERAVGTIAFAAVPSWVAELIIPVAFAVIAARYLILSIESLMARGRT